MLEMNRIGTTAFILGTCIKYRLSVHQDSYNLSTGPFPNEIANTIRRIKELNPEHSFLGQPLLWHFAFYLYKWSDLKRFLTYEEFKEMLVKNGTFSKTEVFWFRKRFYIKFLNKLIKKRAKHYRQKILCVHDSRF